MKSCLKILLLVLAIAMCPLHSAALTEDNDTLFIYDTWQEMLYGTPEKMIINPLYEVATPHEIYIVTGDERLDYKLVDEHLAISFGDSIWLISSTYLKRNFKGDVKRLNGYIPVFFNDKAAFITQLGKLSVKDILIGP